MNNRPASKILVGIIIVLALIACNSGSPAINSETLAWRASTALGFKNSGDIQEKIDSGDKNRYIHSISKSARDVDGFSDLTKIWYRENCPGRCTLEDGDKLRSVNLTIISFKNDKNAEAAYKTKLFSPGQLIRSQPGSGKGDLEYKISTSVRREGRSGDSWEYYHVWARHGRVISDIEALAAYGSMMRDGYVKEIGPDDLIYIVRRIHYMVGDMEDEFASQ